MIDIYSGKDRSWVTLGKVNGVYIQKSVDPVNTKNNTRFKKSRQRVRKQQAQNYEQSKDLEFPISPTQANEMCHSEPIMYNRAGVIRKIHSLNSFKYCNKRV